VKQALAAVAAAVTALSVPAFARAPAPAVTAPLRDLNAIRSQLGLASLEPNPIAQRLVAEIAIGDQDDRLPQTLDSQPECAVCTVFFDRRGVSVDPRSSYTHRGGTGGIGFALWRAGWTAKQNLSVFFAASAIVLDPRARTFSVARTPRGMLLIAVTVDPKAPFRKPVRWPVGAVDPRRQLWAQLLLPPGTRGDARLLERRGERLVVTAHPLADTSGIAGARLVAFGLNATLAYGHRYTARVGPIALPLATSAMPPSFSSQTWTFGSFTEDNRRAFLDVVARSPPLMRRLADEFDGAVRVLAGRGPGCNVADACEHVEAGTGTVTLTFRRFEPYVIAHELGHAVFDLALDEPGRELFRLALIGAGWDWDCCIPLSEAFADQIAFWALGGKPEGMRTYADRLYLPPDRFEALLRQNGGYRPLPTVGLLKR
jgi:hypothetical protein